MSLYVPAVAALSRKEIEADATNIIRNFRPRLLQSPGQFPVLEFFDHVLPESYDLDTGVSRLSAGVEGMTWPDGRVLVSEETYRGASEGQGRARFTVCHECYHGIKHRSQLRQVIIDTGELVLHRRTRLKPFVDPEWQANQFAAALLMPRNVVLELLQTSNTDMLPFQMAKIFGVSMQAAEIRLKSLKGSS